ncbi:MAG: SDR family NAD(P)-dependent oxidoreductase [Clostridia bacterium]|nr:SDR family NAD(P)-dependent oxidoreductase [Clostridia bacterium]
MRIRHNRGCEKWITANTADLKGKRIAVFGSTGGIGRELCRYILRLGGELILVNRNACKAEGLVGQLRKEFPAAPITGVTADLEDIVSVEAACRELLRLEVDAVIHNAGAYSIPRTRCSTGFDAVFQINFVSPYYITCRLAEHLAARRGRVVVVGSIAHNYAKTDPQDRTFATRRQASLAYGNAKRHLMYAAYGWADKNPAVGMAVTHPGITFTNITAHYPPWLFVLIKHPMKWLFMPPRKAALNIIAGLFTDTPPGTWIGPRLFNVWGLPRKKTLCTASQEEQRAIIAYAETLYETLADTYVAKKE